MAIAIKLWVARPGLMNLKSAGRLLIVAKASVVVWAVGTRRGGRSFWTEA